MFRRRKPRPVPVVDIRRQAEEVLKENRKILKAQLASLSGDFCPADTGEMFRSF